MNRHLGRVIAKLRNFFSANKEDLEFEREITVHLEFLENGYLRQGLTQSEAHRRARIACGGIEHTRQAHRNERSFLWVSQAGQDLRHALRTFSRARGFTAVAILTFALGIGANIAVFSVVDTVLLRPLSYPDPDRIVQFFLTSKGGEAHGQSIPDLRFLLDRASSVQDICAYDFAQSVMGLTSGISEQVRGIHVTSNYFRLFGAPFMLGRALDREDDRVSGPRVVVLSYALWTRKFAGDRNIVGKAISLDKQSYTVIGVTAESFHSEPEAQLWIPFQLDLNNTDKLHSFAVAGRLKPRITLDQANAQLHAVSKLASSASDFPDPDFEFRVRGLRDAMVGEIRSALLTLQGAVGFVLLIACANLANLLLVRMTSRRREFAIRAAIGAGSGRILRQLIVESLLLSSAGCIAGTLVGVLAINALLKFVPGDLPIIQHFGEGIGVDWRVLLFAAGLSIVTGLVFAIVPSLAAFRPRLTDTLKESGNRQGLGIRAKWLHSLTVISEVALALILLIGAALLIRTFIMLNRVEPGFDSNHVLMMTMPMGSGRPESAAKLSAMVHDARQQLAGIPGVEASAATFSPPYASRMGLPFSFMGASGNSGDGDWIAASAGYFQVLKTPILRGRAIDSRDESGGLAVVMINETMAKQYWPHQNPLGQQIVIGRGLGSKFEDTPRTIIGIFGNTRDDGLTEAPAPTMVVPDTQEPEGIVEMMSKFGPIWWMIRTRIEPHQLIPAISEQLRKASGGRPVGDIRTMDDILARSIERQRFNMFLLSIFAFAALVLVAVGVYGVIAHSVAQRSREIGVRMALGADRPRVLKMVLREAMTKGTVGVVCGTAAAFFLARLLAGLLFGVSSHDAAVFIATPLFLEVVTAIAAFIPARRAANCDPAKALRGE